MRHSINSDTILLSFGSGWRQWLAWSVCLAFILFLGVFRAATDAELAMASFAILPVLFIAWTGGAAKGLAMSMIAAGMWVIGDVVTGREFSSSWIPWANAVTRIINYGLIAFLAAQVRLLLDREHGRATRDGLTGLLNRRGLLEVGAGEIERSRRYAHSVAIIFLDLDDFKLLNDTKGHDNGDAALRASASALLGALRSSDHVARLGGDEFAALLPEIGYEAAVETGRKIAAAVNDALRRFPPAGVSVGVAWFGNADRSFDAMLKVADEMMYEVKAHGKGHMRSKEIFPLTQSP